MIYMETVSYKFFQSFSPKFFPRKQFFLRKSSKMQSKSLYDTTHLISNSSIIILKTTSLNEFNSYFVAFISNIISILSLLRYRKLYFHICRVIPI